MRFLKRFFLSRLLSGLESARQDNYKTEDGLRVLTALRKVINSDNPIEYFSVRKMLDAHASTDPLRKRFVDDLNGDQ